MFDEWERGNDWDRQVDEIEARIVAKEAEICRLRSEQAQDLARLDRLQVDLADGDRGMVDWVSSHLDVSHQTAMRLMQIARADDPAIHEAMRQGRWGLDRAKPAGPSAGDRRFDGVDGASGRVVFVGAAVRAGAATAPTHLPG